MKKLLLLLLFPAFAHAQFTPDPSGIHFLKAVVSDDYRKALDGYQAGIDWHLPKSSEKITAFALSRDYRLNPESAAERFNGKWLTVGGEVVDVGVDPDGKPFVEYGVSNESIQNVHARFDTGHEFAQGTMDWVICQASGTRAGAPVLDHCMFKYPTNERGYITPEVDAAINHWFVNGKVPWFAQDQNTRVFLFAAYWAGIKLSGTPQCPSDALGAECGQALENAVSGIRTNPEFTASYNAARPLLHLPTLKFHGVTK